MKISAAVQAAAAAILLLAAGPTSIEANLKVADTVANLGSTAAQKTPLAVLDIVGNSDGNGAVLPSLMIRGAAADISPIVQVNYNVADKAALEVGGAIKVGPSQQTCSSPLYGSIRFSEASGLQVCNQNAWTNVTPDPVTTATPTTTAPPPPPPVTPAPVAQFPAGMVSLFATANRDCPSGWLPTNGAIYKAADYPALAAIFGTTADGTFRVPRVDAVKSIPDNIRGYFKDRPEFPYCVKA